MLLHILQWHVLGHIRNAFLTVDLSKQWQAAVPGGCGCLTVLASDRGTLGCISHHRHSILCLSVCVRERISLERTVSLQMFIEILLRKLPLLVSVSALCWGRDPGSSIWALPGQPARCPRTVPPMDTRWRQQPYAQRKDA